MDELTLRRFKAKVTVIDDCWIWVGALTARGYGKMKVYGEHWLAHRLSYTHKYGPIPEGLVVDHKLEEGICSSPRCVRPSHLQLLTHVENNYKQAGSTATHYKCGHPRQDAPSRVGCRICYNAAQRERYHKYADMGYYNPETWSSKKASLPMKYYLMFPFFFVGLSVATLWISDRLTTVTPQTWEQCDYLNIDCR